MVKGKADKLRDTLFGIDGVTEPSVIITEWFDYLIIASFKYDGDRYTCRVYYGDKVALDSYIVIVESTVREFASRLLEDSK